MVKHTQTIRRNLPTNCLSVFDHFVKLALEVLRILLMRIKLYNPMENPITSEKITLTVGHAFVSTVIF